MSYHGSHVRHAMHYLGDTPPRLVARGLGDTPPRLVARVLGAYHIQGLGIDRIALKEAQGKTVSALEYANAAARTAISPAKGVIDALPFLSNDDKRRLITKPLDFLLDIFDPIENAVGRACDSVIAQKGRTQFPFWLLGSPTQVLRVQRGDEKLDPSTRNVVKRFRTMYSYIVLTYTQPVEMFLATAKEGLKFVGIGGTQGLGDLGDAGVSEAFAAIAAAVGPVLAEMLPTIIDMLPTLVKAAGDMAAADASAKAAAEASAKAAADASAREAAARVARVVATPGSPTKLGPVNPPSTASSGVSPVVIVAGAAALALLILQTNRKAR